MTKEGGKPLVPRSRSLLQSVKRAMKLTDMVGLSRIDEAGRLLAVDHLIKSAVEEGILDVELPNRSNAENEADRGRLHNGAERLVVVHGHLLRETADDPTSFVASKRANLCQKSTCQKRCWLERDEEPRTRCRCRLKLELHGHGLMPVRVLGSCTVHRGYQGEGCCHGREIEPLARRNGDPSFGMSPHDIQTGCGPGSRNGKVW